MGVDVHILIKHDFHELEDYEKSMQYVMQTANRVREALYINDNIKHFDVRGFYDEDNKWSDICFRIPLLDVNVELRRGYWNVWSGHHFCQVTNKVFGRLHISDLAFDVARSLGQNEAWYCDEYDADKYYENNLEELLAAVQNKYTITEYPYSELMQYADDEFPTPANFYHDSFTELRREFAELHEKCGDYTPTSIRLVGKYFVRVTANGKFNLYNLKESRLQFREACDDFRIIRGCNFVCKNNGKVALFGKEGKQLTDFVIGNFTTEWGEHNPFDKFTRIIIHNHTAKIKVIATYYKDGSTVYVPVAYKSVIVRRKPIKCPHCKGKVLPIIYGEPTPECGEKAAKGEIILGGCNIYQGLPRWRCQNCNTDFIHNDDII